MCKSQCQSIKGKVVADLGRSGKENGLNYISFYRATIFGDFGIFDENTRNRLINSVFQRRRKNTRNDEEQRLYHVINFTSNKLKGLMS